VSPEKNSKRRFKFCSVEKDFGLKSDTQSRPKVSVVINSYNYARFLGRAIESGLRQKAPGVDVEIVVVDDGSTDKTPEVAAAYTGRIRYYRQSNGGQAAAIHSGCQLAEGDFICLLDADDEFAENKVARVLEAFAEDGSRGAVYNSYDRMDAAGVLIGEHAVWSRAGQDVRQYGLFWMAGGVPTSCISLRRDVARKLVMPKEFRLCADTYILAALPHLTRIGWINDPLTFYRIHGENAFATQEQAQQRKLMLQNWRIIHSTLKQAYGVELSSAVFEIQEQRAAAKPWSALASTCFAGLIYIVRAEASTRMKLRETAKLVATAMGLHRSLTE
jgi:glycosyltransferase involved in cell wall biosynthesis